MSTVDIKIKTVGKGLTCLRQIILHVDVQLSLRGGDT
jgi:hypothetical protein